MKYIKKGGKPAILAKFERENAKTPEVATFDGLTSEAKEGLRKALLREQGFLCAYTMRRIGLFPNANDFHIEHIRPQSRYPELQIDYDNMVLCAPDGHCDWGARHKDQTDVAESNFVSPLRADCETRFAFRRDGSVRPASDKDGAAQSTLDLLNLNHRELVAQRAEALRRFGLGPLSPKPLGARKALLLSQRICEPGPAGAFEAFCVAIQQAAQKVGRQAEERSFRLRGTR